MDTDWAWVRRNGLALWAIITALPLFSFLLPKDILRKDLKDDNEETINLHSNYKHATWNHSTASFLWFELSSPWERHNSVLSGAFLKSGTVFQTSWLATGVSTEGLLMWEGCFVMKTGPSFAYAVVDDWFFSNPGLQSGSKPSDCSRLGWDPESVLRNSTWKVWKMRRK